MQLIGKNPEELRVTGEDWDSLIWHNGKLYSGSLSDGKVQVWSGDLQPLAQFSAHGYPIYHMTPGPGTTFFTSSFDCTIKHWEEKEDGSFHLIATLEGHSEPPRRLCFHNEKLYSGDDTGIVKIWRAGKCVGSIETVEEVWDLLVSDGEVITVRNVDVTLYSLMKKDEKISSSVKNSIPGRAPLHYAAGKEYLCIVDKHENAINVHERKTTGNPKAGQLQGHAAIINAMTSVNDKFLVTGASDNLVMAWNLQDFSEHGRIDVPGCVNVLAATPEGKVYAAGENKFIICFQV